MKRNYIVPSTELTNFASEGIMQDALNIATTSGGGYQTVSNMQDID
jgi:hypothetical protein